MSRAFCLDRLTDVTAATTGIIAMTREGATNTVTKIPTHGHFHFGMTSISLGACTIILKGTNNPDPTSTDGESLITNTHGAANQQDGSAANKGYAYVFVHVTANAGGVDRIIVHGTGFAGTA